MLGQQERSGIRVVTGEPGGIEPDDPERHVELVELDLDAIAESLVGMPPRRQIEAPQIDHRLPEARLSLQHRIAPCVLEPGRRPPPPSNSTQQGQRERTDRASISTPLLPSSDRCRDSPARRTAAPAAHRGRCTFASAARAPSRNRSRVPSPPDLRDEDHQIDRARLAKRLEVLVPFVPDDPPAQRNPRAAHARLEGHPRRGRADRRCERCGPSAPPDEPT